MRPCVLLAEDDDDLRRMMAVALRCDGYDVVEAKSGVDLLDRIATALLEEPRGWVPDVIVSDIRMPGLTGLEIAAGLHDASWRTPIVLITAYGSDQTRKEARSAGVRALFQKPFDIDDLRTVVLNLVPAR